MLQKRMRFCACVKNHVICLRWPKCFIAVVLADVHLLIYAYTLIYGHFQQHLYCACAETVTYKLSVST